VATLTLALASPLVTATRAGAATTTAACAPTTGLVRRSVTVNGVRRSYLVQTPVTASAAAPAPVVLAFHGYSSSAATLAATSRLAPALAARGVVTILPDGTRTPARWSLPDRLPGGDDDAFVDALLRDVVRRSCGDPARVSLAGFSNGAAFVGHQACRRPDAFRSLTLVGGAGLVTPCGPERTPPATPVLLVHGRADRIVPMGGGPVLGGTLQAEPFLRAVDRWRRAPGRKVTVRIIPGWGHRWPSLATEEIVATFAA
jgi:polyhydroxybutyrate depolymerase